MPFKNKIKQNQTKQNQFFMYDEVAALSTLLYDKNLTDLVSHLRLLYCHRTTNQKVVAFNQVVSSRSNSSHSGGLCFITSHTLNFVDLLPRSVLTLKVLENRHQKLGKMNPSNAPTIV